jgi:DNA-binding winged helix-turn-helix (wHTH) protein
MFIYPSPRDQSDQAAWSVWDDSSATAPALPTVLRFGRCEVRTASREILVDGQLRALQPRPFDLLLVLIESRARVRTTNELLDEVWRHQIVQPGSLAAAVMRIRQALCEGEPGIGQLIRTYPRVGYRFVAVLDGEVAR